ncbi:phage tail protein [Vibrio kasasachensis]|uniref:tail fiber protein n=1 Tax=Vibrio kasasachensis TaxID=2910248 RepID=UPI003D118C1A
MSALQAIPTPHGIEILNSELKNTVTKYQLIGALTHDAASDALHSFHTATIETSYYDENGVLTFILNLPIETHFDEYLHRIDVLDSQNQAVIECPTPKIALAKGIGGIVTLKAAISGQAGDVVFKHGEYVTETELKELYLLSKEDANNAASNGDIDGKSTSLKHVKLPQLWRAFSNLVKNASLTTKGIVLLSNSYQGSSENKAVTEKALKEGLVNSIKPRHLVFYKFETNSISTDSDIFDRLERVGAGSYKLYFREEHIKYDILLGGTSHDFIIAAPERHPTHIVVYSMHSSNNAYYDQSFSLEVIL